MRALRGGGASVPSFYFNFSNPANVTLGAAAARGNITSTQNAHITMSASTSRVVGVAPLYVNIDMTGTTSDLTTNATHDLFYSVNWGDSGAGQWANGVQSAGLTDKNWSFGPVGGHVFETPGTYLVTPTSTDGVNSATKPGYVTVLDPNTVYTGASTICISHSGNFTGAPSGATQVNTSGNTDMYAAWNTYKASNKRILFCKADVWTQSATVSLSSLTGTTLGGYGTGVARSFGTGTLVSVVPSPGITQVFQAGGSTDCKVCDFKVTANATLLGCVSTTADSVQLLWYRNEVFGAYGSFSMIPSAGSGNLFVQDQHCMFECVSNNVYGVKGVDLFSTSASGAIGTPGVFTATDHAFQQYNKVRLTGTPPAPLATGTDYYISATSLTANTFCLSAAMYPDTPLALSGTGTCTVANQGQSGGISAFVAMKRGGIMGCYLDSTNHGEQTLRIPYHNTAHITNNYIARPNQGKNVVKIHSRTFTEINGVSSGYSEKLVFSANKISLVGGYSYDGTSTTFIGSSFIAIGEGGGGDERARNTIFENNLTISGLGNPKDSNGFLQCGCPNVTVRNNIFDASVGDRSSSTSTPYIYTYMFFVTVFSSTADPTVGVRVYNNSAYSNLANAQVADFVRVNYSSPKQEVDQLTVKNNLWYYPFHGNSDKNAVGLGASAAPTNVVSSNNTDVVAGGGATVSPNFAATPPVALSDWRPTSGYAVDQGTTVPVIKDFNMVTRTGTYDLGAVLP